MQPHFFITTVIFAIALQSPLAQAQSPKIMGTLNCKQAKSQPYFPCPFVAERQGPGTAKVEITFPDGTIRTITYKDGKATSTDDGRTLSVEKIEDLAVIHIGSESYEIVDAVPFGG